MAPPLEGWRVLVTRPLEQAPALVTRLRAEGAEVVAAPTISLGPPPDLELVREAAEHVSRHDVLVLTSQSAAQRFADALAHAGTLSQVARLVVAVVGRETERVARELGLRVDVVPREARGEGLADALLSHPLVASRRDEAGRQGRRLSVLLPRARVAREVLPERLRAAGIEVDVVAVYEVLPPEPASLDEVVRSLEARALDAALFTSGSTVSGLVDVLGARARALLAPVRLVSIGPVTTAALEEHGLVASAEAREPNTEALVEALVELSREPRAARVKGDG
jgi:uroporphyrinogen III methyltransferase/synthase